MVAGISRFDVVVAGAGLVGASLALALSRRDMRVALVDAAPPAPLPELDSRIYALSPASADFLSALGVWGAIDPARLAPVEAMQVHGDSGESRLEFSAYECGVAQLAWIVESARVQSAIWRMLEAERRVALHCPARCEQLLEADNAIVLSDGSRLGADLLVAADGSRSWLRDAAGIGADAEPYDQLGVVANFGCELPHRNVARQWFGREGVLAWLPLPGNRMSMVWSTSSAHGRELAALGAAELEACVASAGNAELGRLRLVTPAAAFPLSLQRARVMQRPGLVLVGDAAHVVHPLAGQGVNLGFSDARELADILAAREAFRNCGDARLLRRYERARTEDILAMRWATDGLVRLFGASAQPLAWLRNQGLNLTDRLPVLKTLLARHALG